VSFFCLSSWSPTKRRVINWVALFCLGALLPGYAAAQVSANLTWTPSSDPSVTGYNIYYGSASGDYTNMVSVDAVTNAVVSNLTEGITYFFAAKAHNNAGNESPFSNEALFIGFTANPNTSVYLAAIPTNSTGDQLTFSLAGTVPAGVEIDPNTGILAWSPGFGFASTTNAITVTITDNTSPTLSTSETMLIVIGDYLQAGLGSTAVQAGQSGVLPVTLAASDDLTNLQLTIPWPVGQLGTPTVTSASPAVTGSVQMQGATAVVDLQISPGQSLAATNTIAQLNFQALPTQTSAFINVPVAAASGVKSNGSQYGNVTLGMAQVVVVGASPLLQTQTSAAQSRALMLYGNPGANYQVQYATNLTPPIAWAPLLNYQQTNVSESVSLDDSQPMVYYRLQQF